MSLASSELKSFEKMELTKGSKKDQLRSTSAKNTLRELRLLLSVRSDYMGAAHLS